ncbi:hypothetical protein MMC10_004671 [Thelotrema lepadinum]|nr:hypothetical protein [Thelotrema lepadinum]
MADSQASTASLTDSEHDSPAASPGRERDLDLSGYPRMFVLETFLKEAQVAELKLELKMKGATLTSSIQDAQLILTAVSKSPRAGLELRHHGLKLESAELVTDHENSNVQSSHTVSRKRPATPTKHGSSPSRKAKRTSLRPRSPSQASTTDDESTASESTMGKHFEEEQVSDSQQAQRLELAPFSGQTFVKVIKIAWLNDSLSTRSPQPLERYSLCEGKKVILSDHSTSGSASFATSNASNKIAPQRTTYLPTSEPTSTAPQTPKGNGAPRSVIQINPTSPSPQYSTKNPSFRGKGKKPALLRETTSEHEEAKHAEIPEWVKEGKKYACERVALQNSPNEKFLEELRVIRHARELRKDKTGIRSYSTIIASIAACPNKLRTANEVLALPGCDQKAADMFRQFQIDGVVSDARTIRNDEYLKVIDLFWHIHGVGPEMARKLYDMRCRTINHVGREREGEDDEEPHGWESLNFEQRVGVKYYDEFQEKISRSESEKIASIVWQHAKQLMGEDIQYMIVGGYRRGKAESGDVDVILSHPDETKTLNKIVPLVTSLGRAGWVTHELQRHEANSKQEQNPSPANIRKGRSSFDSLDKALVVWQDPTWPTKKADRAADPKAKNPAMHRRVDIIISPWKTVGCAVLGWSSGTTFQRDIRLYATDKKNWKFDSTGVKDLRSGKWVDLERWTDLRERATTMAEAEKRVCDGMELEWHEPWERCTD